MRNKAKWFAILVFFTLCLGLLTVLLIPLPYEGLDWLSLGPAIAAQYDEEPTPQPPGQVEPARGRKGVFDPTGAKDITFDFPQNSIPASIDVKAFRVDLPADVPPPSNGIIGSPFFFGAWIRGQGKTVEEFFLSITIHVPYDDTGLSQIPGSQQPEQDYADLALPHLDLFTDLPLTLVTYPATAILSPHKSGSSHYNYIPLGQESQIRLNMYNPTTETWVKLCSRTDAEGNKVSAALVFPTPLQEGDNALFALTVDDTPALNQTVDDQGKTTLSIPGNNFKLGVLPGTVEVGTHFEITRLPNAPDSGALRLLPTPVDVKACQADYTVPDEIRQMTQFPKPMEVVFDFDANTANRAGGKANLTIVSLQKRQWVDLEEAGSNIVRGDINLTVDSNTLSSFSLATR